MNITKQLGYYASQLTYQDLPERTIQNAKKCILDWAGVCIRGSHEKPIRILRGVLEKSAGSDMATVLTAPVWRTTPWESAFANGAASHSLDFDDLHNASIIHLATVVCPPALAVTEAEKKSGKDMITSVVAGYEVGARVGESIIPESYHFWHTTGTAGIFGAAAAAGNLLRLNGDQMVQCLGTAGTQAAGLWEFLIDGAMSKTIHAGKASYAGVLSAYLSRDGFTGATRILEGDKGFCKALSSNPHWERLTDGLGNGHYKIDDNSFKPYACCKHSHAAIFAGICLRETFRAEEIEKVTIYVNDITDSLINNPTPQTAYGCKFSIQYCLATALLYGEVGIDHFTEEAIRNADVRALMAKVEVVRDPQIEAIKASDPTKLASKVAVQLYSGDTCEQLVEYPKGDPDNTLTIAEMRAKFDGLATPVIGADAANQIAEMILHLEEVSEPTQILREALSR